MASQVLGVVCAWCNQVVVKAPAGAAVSHAICPPCADWAMSHPTRRAASAGSDPEQLQRPADSFGDARP